MNLDSFPVERVVYSHSRIPASRDDELAFGMEVDAVDRFLAAFQLGNDASVFAAPYNDARVPSNGNDDAARRIRRARANLALVTHSSRNSIKKQKKRLTTVSTLWS